MDDLHSAAGYVGEVGVNGWGGGLPKPSLEENPAVFLHPKDNMGVLIELQQANIYRTRDEQPSAVGMEALTTFLQSITKFLLEKWSPNKWCK